MEEEKAAVAARRERQHGQQPAPAAQSVDDEAQSTNVNVDPDPAAADQEYGSSREDDEDFDEDFDEAEDLEDSSDLRDAEAEDAAQNLDETESFDETPERASVSTDGSASAPDDDDEVGPLSLADELGVQELGDIVFVDQGRLFSAAGRSAPIVELTEDDDLLIRPPEKPLSDDLPVESIKIREDDRGILLNELGERRKILGVKFRGSALYYLGDKAPDGTQRHYVGFFDASGNLCRLYLQGRAVTTDIIYKLRVRTHDGELGVFPELTDDPENSQASAPGAPIV